MALPLLISVPHAGLSVPPEVQEICILTKEEIIADGDVGAAEIYDIKNEVETFVTTDVARAIVDLNRAEDDRRPDGVVKTHTCWNVPVYDPFPSEEVVQQLLNKYYHPYHTRLSSLAGKETPLAVDCHTMAETGPPVGPDAGQRRPAICLGDCHGASLPSGWTEILAKCFRDAADWEVTINQPFSGGFITKRHSTEQPWVQIEFSRGDFASNKEKRKVLLTALTDFCKLTF